MIEELRAKLADLSAQLERMKKIDNMLLNLKKEEAELAQREHELKIALSKEEADVQRLEKTTATSVFYTILGKKDVQMDKEQQEAYAARLKYDAVVYQLDDCKMRIEKLLRERTALSGCSKQYDQVFAQLQELLLATPAYAEQLCTLERQRGEAVSQLKEVDEAISAGNAAMMQIENIEKNLSSAEGWGTWDLFGGGLVSDLAKHSKLDEAQSGAEYLQVLLSRFRNELADVHINTQMNNINIDGFLRFADYFFDGLIADWSVLSRIHDSQASVRQIKEQVGTALSRLSFIKTARVAENAEVEKQIRELVTNA